LAIKVIKIILHSINFLYYVSQFYVLIEIADIFNYYLTSKNENIAFVNNYI